MEAEVLNKKKVLAPKLRFKGFNDNWNKTSLFEISENVAYGMNAAAVEFDGIHKYIRITDIDEETGTFKPNPQTSPDGNKDDKFKLKEGDIVFARTGASVGKSYLYNPKDGNLYYAGFLIKFSLINADPFFVYSITLKESYNKWVHIYSMRSGQPGLNAEEYKALKIHLPSVPEQQKIASFLSAVDEKIQLHTHKKELLTQYKKGVMQQLFSGKLRFKDEQGKDFPEWEEKKLGNLTFKVGKKNSKNIKYPIYSINNQEGFRPQSEQFDGLDSNDRGYDISLYKIFDAKTFAYNPARINVGSIGYSHNIKEGIVSSLYVCFKTKEILDDLYLLSYFETYKFKKDILRFEEGGVRQYLFFENFSQIKIPLPSIEEQKIITKFINEIDLKIKVISSQIAQTQTFKKGLLQQMFV
jgi:type I restriction enzyme S subunit